jgi:hypothetical protein
MENTNEYEYGNKLNDDWINNFEKSDKLYQDFYKDDVYYANLQFIYLNRSNEIDKIKQETFLMTIPNMISREEIIGILKKNLIEDDKRYTLLSILRYNIILDVEDVKNFVIKKNSLLLTDNFLSVIKNIDAISFKKTINMFHDLNELIFVLHEKTRVVNTNNNNTNDTNYNNITKKIYLKNTNKKTIRKQYKD